MDQNASKKGIRKRTESEERRLIEKRKKFESSYKYEKRTYLGFEETKKYLIDNDISCIKYHYNVEK